MQRDDLRHYLDELLEVARTRDYCPNGLQVEGRAEIGRIVCGVSASQLLIEQAVARGADALIVHHGYFWKGEDPCVTGIRRRRLATLLAADINLFAFHLPLDLHAEFGNNVQLAKVMGWTAEGRFGEQDLGFIGRPSEPSSAGRIARSVAAKLGRDPLLAGDPERNVRKVAWCTGAAQSFFESAIAAGADLYVSGEISEQTVHLARESGVPYLAAGHHATERYGVHALGEHLRARFGLKCEFIDLDNPV